MKLIITPGSMSVVSICIDLFGIEKVEPNSWSQPVFVNNLSENDAASGKQLLEEKGYIVILEKEN